MSGAPGLVEHFFRHEYSRLVAVLTHRFGLRHIETVEDAVQTALTRALVTWTADGLPENPSGWLFRVALNQVIDDFRRKSARSRILSNNAHEFAADEPQPSGPFIESEGCNDLLHMLFACCDDAISVEAQLVLALKVLCGFDVREIAARLFISEETAYKRLTRARGRLKRISFSVGALSNNDYRTRLPAVHKIIYLMFTEGYLSSHADRAIRQELCGEAVRLATILVEHPAGRDTGTYALLALMHLHIARLGARQDAAGGLLLLEEQDRSLWDQDRIAIGLQWLAKGSQGDRFTRFHAEAGVAAEHCMARSFAETKWERVAECYALLEQIAPSAIHRLNRAVALAEWQGAEAGLKVLEGLEPPSWFAGSFLWSAVLADLHFRCGHTDDASHFRALALETAPSPAIKALLARRLDKQRWVNAPTSRHQIVVGDDDC